MDKLEITDEAAPGVTETGVVDVRCLEPDAAGVMLVLVRFGRFEMALQGGQWTAKDVEGDNACD